MRYEAPESVESAVSLLANGAREPRVLAGGTDLLVQLRAGMIDPDLIVDIKNIREAREINAENGGYRVGAAVSGAELGEHHVARLFHGQPVLAGDDAALGQQHGLVQLGLQIRHSGLAEMEDLSGVLRRSSRHVEYQVWHALLESAAAEQAARMTAMENASKNAKELIEQLTLTMNKVRQSTITREILEIVSGAEAIK